MCVIARNREIWRANNTDNNKYRSYPGGGMDHKRSYPRTINVIVPTIIDDICDRPIGTDRVSLGIRSYQVFEISIDDYKVTTAIPILVKETYSCLSFLNTEIVIHHLLPLTLFEPKIQRLFSINLDVNQTASIETCYSLRPPRPDQGTVSTIDAGLGLNV